MTNPCALFTSCCDSFPSEEFIKSKYTQKETKNTINYHKYTFNASIPPSRMNREKITIKLLKKGVCHNFKTKHQRMFVIQFHMKKVVLDEQGYYYPYLTI